MRHIVNLRLQLIRGSNKRIVRREVGHGFSAATFRSRIQTINVRLES